MNWSDWQLWLTLAIVAAAAVALFRRMRAFVTGRGKSACDDCSAKSRRDEQTQDRLIDDLEDWTTR
ncbi:hypothetical protein GC176_01065 [bacterium]|nr:hypothetical protein [bacterium]